VNGGWLAVCAAASDRCGSAHDCTRWCNLENHHRGTIADVFDKLHCSTENVVLLAGGFNKMVRTMDLERRGKTNTPLSCEAARSAVLRGTTLTTATMSRHAW
jgi:hypothetical protein